MSASVRGVVGRAASRLRLSRLGPARRRLRLVVGVEDGSARRVGAPALGSTGSGRSTSKSDWPSGMSWPTSQSVASVPASARAATRCRLGLADVEERRALGDLAAEAGSSSAVAASFGSAPGLGLGSPTSKSEVPSGIVLPTRGRLASRARRRAGVSSSTGVSKSERAVAEQRAAQLALGVLGAFDLGLGLGRLGLVGLLLGVAEQRRRVVEQRAAGRRCRGGRRSLGGSTGRRRGVGSTGGGRRGGTGRRPAPAPTPALAVVAETPFTDASSIWATSRTSTSSRASPLLCAAVRPSSSITRQNGQPTAIWSAPVADGLAGAVLVDPLADPLLHPHAGAAGAAAEGPFGGPLHLDVLGAPGSTWSSSRGGL